MRHDARKTRYFGARVQPHTWEVYQRARLLATALGEPHSADEFLGCVFHTVLARLERRCRDEGLDLYAILHPTGSEPMMPDPFHGLPDDAPAVDD